MLCDDDWRKIEDHPEKYNLGIRFSSNNGWSQGHGQSQSPVGMSVYPIIYSRQNISGISYDAYHFAKKQKRSEC